MPKSETQGKLVRAKRSHRRVVGASDLEVDTGGTLSRSSREMLALLAASSLSALLASAPATISAPATGSTTESGRNMWDRLSSPDLVPWEDAQRTPAVRLPNFLSEYEQEQLHELAIATRETGGAHHGLAKGNWRTTFINQRLPEHLPDLWSRIMAAWRQADAEHFGILEEEGRECLHLRSAEYHVVLPTGNLAQPKHLDYGSLLTIDFMLSDTSEFEGGTFSTLEADGTLKEHIFERGDAIIFLSHKFHCVAPVTSGRRNVLVAELWEGLPRQCPRRCSDPFGPCYCKYEPNLTALHEGGERSEYEPPWLRVRKPGTADSPAFVNNFERAYEVGEQMRSKYE